MTLINDLELRDSPYFVIFPQNSIPLQADYVTVVEDRPILSAEYCPPLLAQTDPPCSVVSAIAEQLLAIVVSALEM